MKEESDSDQDDDVPKGFSHLVAMVNFGGYAIEGGESRKTKKRKW